MKKLVLTAVVLILCGVTAYPQFKGKKKNKEEKTVEKTANDSVKVKKYDEIITSKAVTKRGLFTVHKVDEKWFFEISDSILNREFLAITRIVKAPAGAGIYGGELVNQSSLYWEKTKDKKLLLRSSIMVNHSDSTQVVSRATRNTSVDPIIAAFEIKTYGLKDSTLVVDATDFLKGDNIIFSISQAAKGRLSLTGLDAERSYINKISSFPINTEVSSVKTYMATAGIPSAGNRSIPAGELSGFVTFEMNTSFVLLPKVPMKRRLFDPRIGYFANEFYDFKDDQTQSEHSKFILRWRLEPKQADLEKFAKGELVEPKKPIVIYIDPATPKKWRSYIIQGINDWQKAFEQAGFKNAIEGREWPENDPNMSLEDARFSVLRYYASPESNAQGPNINDPRTGEIIGTNIAWHHNVMQLLHDWYMMQAGAVDPDAGKMKFDDELMGQLIRFASSHEVGHTMGLRHNMGASSTVPVENLRNKKWVEANGHTPSIMDYARFNYVAQPEDNISRKGIFPRIGAYDRWAIKWGYMGVQNAADEKEESKILNKIVIDSLAANKMLWYGTEDINYDPRSQMEDLSDDVVKANDYGIKNLKRIMLKLPEFSFEEGDYYTNLKQEYNVLLSQYATYIGHVSNVIGGIYITPKSVEQSGDVYTVMGREKAKAAIDFLNRNLFQEQKWLTQAPFISKVIPNPYDISSGMMSQLMMNIVRVQTFNRLMEFSKRSDKAYTLDEYLTDLENCIFTELAKPDSVTVTPYRRDLQRNYVSEIYSTVYLPMNDVGGNPVIFDTVLKTDLPSLAKSHLTSLKLRMSKKALTATDKMTKVHYQDLAERIGVILNRR